VTARPILALIVDDPPRKTDTVRDQQDKAIAAGEEITGWLRDYGLDVRFGGLLETRAERTA
jgi:hypothetical protein